MHLLEKYEDRITSCRVVIDSPHHHHHKGNLYRVSIDVKVPGQELVAAAGTGDDHAHEDVYIAIRDAFESMSRRLHDYCGRLH
jgi:ribosome-associated translation inhibitor RaiA